MNIILNEIGKIARNCLFWWLLAAAFFVNLFFLRLSEERKRQLYSPAQYREVYGEICEMTPEQAQEFLENELRTSEQEVWRTELLRHVLSEVLSVASYPEYLQKVQAEAERVGTVSIFANADGFSNRNIKKTAEKYRGCEDICPAPGPSQGIVLWSECIGTDILALLLLGYLVFFLFSAERENGALLMTFSTKHGHLWHGISKLVALFVFLIVIILFLWGTGLFFIARWYGLGALSRPVQSVLPYKGCVLHLSVGAYFGLFLLLKLCALFFLAVLVAAVLTGSRTTLRMYFGIVLLFGTELIFSYKIPRNANWCILKYANLMSFTNAGAMLGDYHNLNLLQKPVWDLALFLGMNVGLLPVFFILFCRRFARQNPIAVGRTAAIRKRRGLVTGSVSVFFQEFYKSLVSERVVWALVALVVFRAATYVPMREYFGEAKDMERKRYLLELEGLYSEEKEEWLQGERERIFPEDGWSAATPERQKAFLELVEHAAYLKEQNGAFLYDTGYRLLTNDAMAGNKWASLLLLANVALAFCVSAMYSNDYQTGMVGLIRTTKNGREVRGRAMTVIRIFIVSLVWGCIYIPFFYNVLHAYGTRGLQYPACSMRHLAGCRLPIGWYLVLLYGGYLGIMQLEALGICFIAKKCKSNSISLLLSLGIFVLPLLFVL